MEKRGLAAVARIRTVLAALVLFGTFAFAGTAHAARTINWVTLNGGASVMVAPGATITVVINVTTTGSGSQDNWRCTDWRIATTPPGATTDENHGNHNSAGTYSETFSITAPGSAGTYNAYFRAYDNDGCSSGASATFTMAGAVIVNTPPTVSSIDLASANPTAPGSIVSWTVTFSENVTGVDAGDFQLVQGGGVSGAGITSVTGSGTTWTVTANTGSGGGTLGLNLVDNDSIVDAQGMPLGGAGAGNGNFTGQVYTVAVPFSCTPPPGSPAGLSCQCDTFARASLNPSTIFGSNWIVSTSDSTGILPSIVNSGYLRLTNNTGNNAKAATVPGIFPAAGNYISVEFQHFAYNGSGADGIAVTLSDYAVPPVPGAFGGSLGYAQKTGINGFAGGWLGVALDEYGNYQNATEGRLGGPGFIIQSVGMRGSGSGTTGYRWLGGTASLSPVVDDRTSTTPSPGYFYQVIVDARNEPTSTAVAVNRDTTGTGTSYASLISIPNVYTAAAGQGFTQDPVPANWQISFTGSTGGATNIHEISKVRICASTVWPPSGGTASGFAAIDEAYGTPPAVAVQNYLSGHIYTKAIGTQFKFNVAAINNNQIQTGYAAGVGNTEYVQLKLVDNSDGGCVLDSSQANYCKNDATCVGKAAVASQVLTFADADDGQKQSANFTLNTAWRNLAAVMRECTTSACSAFTATPPACSTDAFAVRPLTVSSVVSSDATNTGTSGTPRFKAGTNGFTLTATVAGIGGNANGYTGVLKINPSATQVVGPATVVGAVTPASFPAATSGTPNATATGSTFKYSEVGAFRFLGYNPEPPVNNTTSARGVFDGVMSATECAGLTAAQCDALRAATWTGVDGISSKGDCIANSFANTRDLSGTFASNPNFGKFGCNFGLYDPSGAGSPSSPAFGRFTPDHFTITTARLKPRKDIATCYGSAPAGTTGSIGAASDQLTVASVAGLAVGDMVVVFGAGTGGSNLVAAVNGIAGSVLTLSAPAVVGVASAPVFELGGMTGSITAGTSVLTVSNATGVAVGNSVAVFGAGPGGGNWASQVVGVAGNALTLAGAAATTVANAPVFLNAGFTYMDEPLQLDLTLEARNGADGRTVNYVGSLAKLDNGSPTGTGSNSWGLWGAVHNVYGVAGCRALFDGAAPFNTSYGGAACAGLPAGAPAAPYAAPAGRVGVSNTGAVTWTAGGAALSTDVTLRRASVPDGAFDLTNGIFALGLWPQDADDITPATATRNLDADATAGAERVSVGVADMRFGRLRLGNAHGSELLALPVPMTLQYWNLASGGFVTNTADSCTAVAPANIGLAGYTKNLQAGETAVGAVTLAAGTGSITMTKPAGGDGKFDGSVNLTVDLVAEGEPWLQGAWSGATYTQNPTGRASFGIFKNANEFIFMREIY